MRGDALEERELVGADDFLHRGPGDYLVGGIWRGDDGDVLCGQVGEEIGTLRFSLGGWDVDLPVWQGLFGATHGEEQCSPCFVFNAR